MTLPHGHLRVGSVSLGAAKKAARAVKSATPDDTKPSPALFERYLGHFGSGARKAKASKLSAGKKGAAKKSSARKAAKKESRRAL